MSESGGRLVGLYPGTFDPVTRGHEDLIERGLRIVDELVVGIAVDTGKESLFSTAERVAMLREVTAGEKLPAGSLG